MMPAGMAQCGAELSEGQCEIAMDAANEAREGMQQLGAALGDLREAVRNGTAYEDMTASQQGLHDAVEAKYGEGSATSGNLRTLAGMAGRAARAIGVERQGVVITGGARNLGDDGGPSNVVRVNHLFFGAESETGVARAAVIAHEVGHKMLGLHDFLIPPHLQRNGFGRGNPPRFYGNSATDWLGANFASEGLQDPLTGSGFGDNNDSFICLAFPAGCGR